MLAQNSTLSRLHRELQGPRAYYFNRMLVLLFIFPVKGGHNSEPAKIRLAGYFALLTIFKPVEQRAANRSKVDTAEICLYVGEPNEQSIGFRAFVSIRHFASVLKAALVSRIFSEVRFSGGSLTIIRDFKNCKIFRPSEGSIVCFR